MSSAIPNKELLLHRLFTHKEKIKSFGVKELGLFGSFKKTAAYTVIMMWTS